jgi:uncharacterized protein (TIGR03382 family)
MSAGGLNPEAMLSDIIFDPNNSQVMYVADRFSGVYRSTDGGLTWNQINNGLRTRAVNKLAVSTDSRHLYAATEGEGVFRLDLTGEPPKSISESLTELPAEPTPDEAAIPTATPEPSEQSGGICGGVAAVPLLLLGLIWVNHRRR